MNPCEDEWYDQMIHSGQRFESTRWHNDICGSKESNYGLFNKKFIEGGPYIGQGRVPISMQ